MNEQEHKMLQEVIELSRDNNAMVRKLVRIHRWATIWRVVYWAIIIGGAIATYYSLEPYITTIIKFFSGQDLAKITSLLQK